jgi:hypothetical protein
MQRRTLKTVSLDLSMRRSFLAGVAHDLKISIIANIRGHKSPDRSVFIKKRGFDKHD